MECNGEMNSEPGLYWLVGLLNQAREHARREGSSNIDSAIEKVYSAVAEEFSANPLLSHAERVVKPELLDCPPPPLTSKG